MYSINVEKSFSKLYHEPLTEKTDFGALESTVCVILADVKRLRALFAVLCGCRLTAKQREWNWRSSVLTLRWHTLFFFSYLFF